MRNKIEKFLSSRIYILIVFIVMFAMWLIGYAAKQGKLDLSYMKTIETYGLTLIGVIVLALLVNFRNLAYVAPWIVSAPFIFAHPFTVDNIPYSLIIALIFLAIGLIANIIKFKQTIKFGSFMLGFLILGIAMTIGGINTKSSFLNNQIIFLVPTVVAALFLYNCLATNIEIKFSDLAFMMTCLGVMFTLEIAFYYIFSGNIILALETKMLEVGWGVSNNIALMILFTFPFANYLAIKTKGFRTVVYVFLSVLQVFAIVLTYSRGAIISSLLGLVFLLAYTIVKSIKNGKECFIPYIATIGVVIVSVSIGATVFLKSGLEIANEFKNVITKINWETLNGRVAIYKEYLTLSNKNLIFGVGLFSPLKDGTYLWGHSTIIHTLYTMGVVGVAALALHMVQKYFLLIRKNTVEKMFAIFALAISGLYGLFDVSYYFACYMVVLIIFLASIERIVNKKSEGE